MKNNNKSNKAFSSLITCLLAGVLAVISFFVIRFGVISKNTFHEKQALDACGYAVGKNIIYSNDIQEFCLNLLAADLLKSDGVNIDVLLMHEFYTQIKQSNHYCLIDNIENKNYNGTRHLIHLKKSQVI